MSGVLSGGGSASGPVAEKLPRWKGKRIGRYRLVDLLGKGSYGRVFVADDVDLHRKVALKIVSAESTAASLRSDNQAPPATGTLTSQTGTGAQTTEQFETLAARVVEKTLSEARAAARLEHPNVVHVYEVGRLPPPPGSPPGTILGGFIAMELLEGGTLHDWVKANGPMDVARACSLVADAAEALQFAHDQGIVHRDLKPANLMLSRHGRCKVVDFGLAMEHDPDGLNKTPIAGTLMFVSPEVTLGKPPGPKSDQYSLGVTLWTLLAARPPYSGNKQQLLDGHRHGAPPALRSIRPDVPESLELSILRAMEKDPDRRFHTIRQFGQTLRTFSGEATAGDATGSFLPDLFADLDDPKAAEAPAKAAPPPVFAEPQIIAAPKPAARAAVRAPALSGPSFTVKRSVARPAKQRTAIWPWLAGAAAAVIALISLIVWAVSSGSEEPEIAQAPQPTSYPRPREPSPGVAANQGQQQGRQPVQPAGPLQDQPVAKQQAQPEPQPQPQAQQQQQPQGGSPPLDDTKPPVADPGKTGAQPPGTQPAPQGSSTPPVMQPVPPASQNQSPGAPAEQRPREPGAAGTAGTGEAAPAAAPHVVANEELLSPTDFGMLLRVSNGGDPARPDKRAVIEGKIQTVRMTPEGMVRLEFAGGMPRRSLVIELDGSNQELLGALQEKFKNKAKHLGVEGTTITVRGPIVSQGTSLCVVVTSADQLSPVAPGSEKLPQAPGPRVPNRRSSKPS